MTTSLNKVNDTPFTEKIAVWSDAQWREAQNGLPKGAVSLPVYIPNPYEPEASFFNIDSLQDKPERAALVLSGYARALIEVSRMANGLSEVWGIESEFEQILKKSNSMLRKFQRKANGVE